MEATERGAALRIGTAGWAVPRQSVHRFPAAGSLLERYAARFNCVEINSTFYRSHRQLTYVRWASAVPDDFRFAVKMPKAITHERRLVDTNDLLTAFLAEIGPLGGKLGPLLVQLPGSFAFERERAELFFALLRQKTAGFVVCEPRHPSWFEDAATELFIVHGVARVAADPPRIPMAAEPGGHADVAYFRLHGAPRMYFSPYDPPRIERLAAQLATNEAAETWCIFDNTGSGAAAADALALVEAMPDAQAD